MITRNAENQEEKVLLGKNEDHFLDFKCKLIKPSKLQETYVAFANTDGGELYIGINDAKTKGNRIEGFSKIEDANDILMVLLEQTMPCIENVDIEFIKFNERGLVLHILIPKSPKVHFTANNKCFIRINANNKEIKGERILSLGSSRTQLNIKGLAKGEDKINIEFRTTYINKEITQINDYYNYTFSWNELFSIISREMIRPCSEYILNELIIDYVRNRKLDTLLKDKLFLSHYECKIRNSDFQKILIQFSALGLIDRSIIDNETHWLLTENGNRMMLETFAIRH